MLAIPLALAAEYLDLDAPPDTLQMLAMLSAVAVYFGFWFLVPGFFCKVIKVSK